MKARWVSWKHLKAGDLFQSRDDLYPCGSCRLTRGEWSLIRAGASGTSISGAGLRFCCLLIAKQKCKAGAVFAPPVGLGLAREAQ